MVYKVAGAAGVRSDWRGAEQANDRRNGWWADRDSPTPIVLRYVWARISGVPDLPTVQAASTVLAIKMAVRF
jgi:hypothetical protein